MTTPRSPAWKTRQKNTLLRKLEQLYPEPRSELNFANEYQLLISVVLSAQCTDKMVNQVTPELFAKYPDFSELGSARLSTLERIIRPINYYRTKAKNLKALSQLVCDRHREKVPDTRELLMELPGVGRKTANVILSETGADPSFPVDTHVLRVSNRLGLSTGKTPEKVEEDLTQEFSSEHWRPLHHWLIFHGRRVCKARNPACPSCSIFEMCHWEDKGMK